MKVIILYIPVIHNGYIKLFEKYDKKVKKLYILDERIISKSSVFKEIRSISSNKIAELIKALGYSFDVKVLSMNSIGKISSHEIVTADDPISNKVVKKYFPKSKICYDTVFLRWNEKAVKSPTPPKFDFKSSSKFDLKIMRQAIKVGNKSSDWWRRVGAVVVKHKKIIVKTYNRYLPTDQNPYVDGNPRDFIKAGTLGFLSTSVHAEQSAIAEACRVGRSLKGADMYVSTYPCPTCAKLMAIVGIEKCFFMGGNAYLNVEEVFKSSGIKTILIEGI